MNNSDWLDIDVLEDYLDGKLDAKEMHRIERISLEDPFVAEALAGLRLSPKRVQSLSLLQKQLQERVAQKPIVEKRWQITAQRLSIAAAAAVLFVTVSLLFWMRESDNREQLAASKAKKVEVAIAPVKESSVQTNALASLSVTKKPAKQALPKKIKIAANAKKEESILPMETFSKDQQLSVASLGVQAKEIVVKKEQMGVAASLTDNAVLNEIIIVPSAKNAQANRSVAGGASLAYVRPEPAIGWEKFELYVIEQNKLLIDKKLTGRYITVSFEVDKDGAPVNLKALKGFKMIPDQTEQEEREAIRLVKEGPKWVLPAGINNTAIAWVNIRF